MAAVTTTSRASPMAASSPASTSREGGSCPRTVTRRAAPASGTSCASDCSTWRSRAFPEDDEPRGRGFGRVFGAAHERVDESGGVTAGRTLDDHDGMMSLTSTAVSREGANSYEVGMFSRVACAALVACAAVVAVGRAQSALPRGEVAFPRRDAGVGRGGRHTEAARERGLMFRAQMAPNEGMVFVFDADGALPVLDEEHPDPARHRSGWTRSSASCTWPTSVPPCKADPCPTYGPPRPRRRAMPSTWSKWCRVSRRSTA